MGKIIERVKLQNLLDPSRETEVDAVVDTGATILALPMDVVAHLGLSRFREVTVRYADCRTQRRGIYGVVTLEIQGRTGHFDVLGEQEGCQPLIRARGTGPGCQPPHAHPDA